MRTEPRPRLQGQHWSGHSRQLQQLTAKEAADTRKVAAGPTCLSCDCRAEVDRLVDMAVATGGCEPRPATDFGFLYGRGFADPDDRTWEIIRMDPSHIQAR